MSAYRDAYEAEMAALNAELAGTGGDLGGLYDLATPDEMETAIELAAVAPALDGLDQLAAITGQLDTTYASEAQRQAEDAAGMPWDTEERTAYLLGRIERGTYTPPPAQYDDTLGNCGPRDDLGYCTARYHDAGCIEVLTAEAANGSAESALAWRQQLLGNQGAVTALHLANEALAAQHEAQARQVHDTGTYREMRHLLGLG